MSRLQFFILVLFTGLFMAAGFAAPAKADPLERLKIETADGSWALKTPTYVNRHALAATTNECDTIPSSANGERAARVNLWGTCNFYTATAPQIQNGTFASDTIWTKGTNWTISGGTANAGGSNTDLSQPFRINTGASYSLTFTVSSRTTGSITALVGGTAGTTRSTNATFTETIIAAATDMIIFRSSSSFDGKIDNVSITPVATYSGDQTDGGASEGGPLMREFRADEATICFITEATGCTTTQSYFLKP